MNTFNFRARQNTSEVNQVKKCWNCHKLSSRRSQWSQIIKHYSQVTVSWLSDSVIAWCNQVLHFNLTKHLVLDTCDTLLRYGWLPIQSGGPCTQCLPVPMQFYLLTTSKAEIMSNYIRGKNYSGDLRWRVVYKVYLEGRTTSAVSRKLSE